MESNPVVLNPEWVESGHPFWGLPVNLNQKNESVYYIQYQIYVMKTLKLIHQY
jgi:hypothetical protein